MTSFAVLNEALREGIQTFTMRWSGRKGRLDISALNPEAPSPEASACGCGRQGSIANRADSPGSPEHVYGWCGLAFGAWQNLGVAGLCDSQLNPD